MGPSASPPAAPSDLRYFSAQLGSALEGKGWMGREARITRKAKNTGKGHATSPA